MSLILKVISCWYIKGWFDDNSFTSFWYPYLSNKTRNLTDVYWSSLEYQYANNGNLMKTIERNSQFLKRELRNGLNTSTCVLMKKKVVMLFGEKYWSLALSVIQREMNGSFSSPMSLVTLHVCLLSCSFLLWSLSSLSIRF